MENDSRRHISLSESVDRYDRVGLANFIKGKREERGIPQYLLAKGLSVSRPSFISVESPDSTTGRKLHTRLRKQDLHLIAAHLELNAEETIEMFRLSGDLYTEEDVLTDASKIRGNEIKPLGDLSKYVGNLIRNFRVDKPNADFMDIYTMLSGLTDDPSLPPEYQKLLEEALSKMEKAM